MKFNVGDKVIPSNGLAWDNGDKYKVIIKRDARIGISRYELSDSDLNWFDSELKLYEEEQKCIEQQTEFTFKEVIARNIPGIYENCEDNARLEKIEIQPSGRIVLRGVFIDCTAIRSDFKFKLQEPKRKVRIIVVEHGKSRKQYEFIGINEANHCSMINKGDFVECDTKYGKCYGKCVDIVFKELTEEEYKQYKECWRA